jgi:hypothetical protein
MYGGSAGGMPGDKISSAEATMIYMKTHGINNMSLDDCEKKFGKGDFANAVYNMQESVRSKQNPTPSTKDLYVYSQMITGDKMPWLGR